MGLCPSSPFHPQFSGVLFSSMGSHLITRIRDLANCEKLLFDAPDAHKAAEKVNAASLIIRATGPGTTKGLLTDDGAGALAIDVEVAGGITQGVFGEPDGGAVGGEDAAGEGVVGGGVDEGAGVEEGGRFGGIVDVDGEDGAEELGGEERVVWIFGEVDGRVDEVARAIVVFAADEQFEFVVGLGVVDDFFQLVEAVRVDDGADEVFESGGVSDG